MPAKVNLTDVGEKGRRIRQFVADGIKRAELKEFLTHELSMDGRAGVEVCVTLIRTEIIILATRIKTVLENKGRRIRQLIAEVNRRFPEDSVVVGNRKIQMIRILSSRGRTCQAKPPSLASRSALISVPPVPST
ncbi:TBC1 domain family member 24 [Sarotherodon galilaeus]